MWEYPALHSSLDLGCVVRKSEIHPVISENLTFWQTWSQIPHLPCAVLGMVGQLAVPTPRRTAAAIQLRMPVSR